MDLVNLLAKQIEAERPKQETADGTPAEQVKEMIESAVSQVKAEMQGQIDAAKARADELEQKLHGLEEKPSPAEPGTNIATTTGGESNG